MRKWRYMVIVCAAVMASISLTSCTDSEENRSIYTLEPEPIITEPPNRETDKEAQNSEFQETEYPEAVASGENLDTEKVIDDENRTAKDNGDKAASATEEPKESSVVNNVSPEQTETPVANQQTSQQTQNVSMSSVTIVGSIQIVGDGSFSISRADINGNVMVIADEMVNVVYSNSTEFEVCTSADGGITASYAAGISADLQTGRIVHVEGVYEGSDFVAQKITIEIFG